MGSASRGLRIDLFSKSQIQAAGTGNILLRPKRDLFLILCPENTELLTQRRIVFSVSCVCKGMTR